MSKYRITSPAPYGTAPSYADSLYMIKDSVERRRGLIYGALRTNEGVCAIGAFFNDNPKLALYDNVIDEVAAYNDSISKTATFRQRRNAVLKWLRWKLAVMAGAKCKEPARTS